MQGWASGMRCLSDGVLLLGAAFGTEEFITEHYEECARDGAALLQASSWLRMMRYAWLVVCIIKRLTSHRSIFGFDL